MGILSNEVGRDRGTRGQGDKESRGVHPKLAGLNFWVRESERLGEALETLAGLLEKAVGVEREGDKETRGQGDKETEEDGAAHGSD